MTGKNESEETGMAALIGLFLELALMIFSLLVSAGLFLLRRMDVTNSLLASGAVQLMTARLEISTEIRWAMFVGLFIAFMFIQRLHKLFRLSFGAFSILVSGAIAYGWMDYNSSCERYKVVGIVVLIMLVINVKCSVLNVNQN